MKTRKSGGGRSGVRDAPRPVPVAPWWERSLPLLVLLVAIVGLAFLRVCVQDFVLLDDGIQVYQDPVLYPITPAHLAVYWLYPFQRMYIPLSYTVWAALSRLRPGAPPVSDTGAPYNPHVSHNINVLLTRNPLPVALGATGTWASRPDSTGLMKHGAHP